MDSGEVLLVLLCQLFLLSLLYILWHDDRLRHTQPPSGRHLRRSLLRAVQSILWILHPETSKLFIWALKEFEFVLNKVCFAINLDVHTILFGTFREYPNGGCGTTGFALWHGRCTV